MAYCILLYYILAPIVLGTWTSKYYTSLGEFISPEVAKSQRWHPPQSSRSKTHLPYMVPAQKQERSKLMETQ